MNKNIFLSATSISITTLCIVANNGEPDVYDLSPKAYNIKFIQTNWDDSEFIQTNQDNRKVILTSRDNSEIIQISQDRDFYIPTISERLIKEIDSEIDALEMDNNQIKKSFIVSAAQLKKLLVNESIKKTPDVVMFNKGYVGLVWETKNDESVFVYSMFDETLFFNKVGINSSETRTLNANRNIFSDLIKEINAMV